MRRRRSNIRTGLVLTTSMTRHTKSSLRTRLLTCLPLYHRSTVSSEPVALTTSQSSSTPRCWRPHSRTVRTSPRGWSLCHLNRVSGAVALLGGSGVLTLRVSTVRRPRPHFPTLSGRMGPQTTAPLMTERPTALSEMLWRAQRPGTLTLRQRGV